MSSETISTLPGCADVSRAIAFNGRSKYFSCGATAVVGFTKVSSVGTSTSEITKSTMIPTAEPIPKDRTATTLLVASDNIPSAVVALAPRSGVARCATVSLNAAFARPAPGAPSPSAA